MAKKVEYFRGIRCKTCGSIVPVEHFRSGEPQCVVWEEMSVLSFTHACEVCKKIHTYFESDLEFLKR
jgi:hypothetical protein